jgi:hypothetical protein
MTGTSAAQSVRTRRSSPLPRHGRRFPNPSQPVPVMNGQVLAEEGFGGDRLLVALDQIQLPRFA